VPPECELHYSLGVGKSIAEGRFGMLPADGSGRQGGVRFSVKLLQVEREPQTLFERVLMPSDQAQSFKIAIPEGSEGAIILRTSYADERKDEREAGFWTGVEIR